MAAAAILQNWKIAISAMVSLITMKFGMMTQVDHPDRLLTVTFQTGSRIKAVSHMRIEK